MRYLTFICSLLLVSSLAWAQGTVSVPFTRDQQNGIQFSLDLANAERAAQNPPLPPLTLSEYAIQQCQAIFSNYVRQRRVDQERKADIRATYLELSDADKAKVEAYLKTCVASGCP